MKLGFQLYSARKYPPYSEIFRKLAASDYSEVEGFGAMYADLDDDALSALKDELDRNKLKMTTGHFGLEMLESSPARVREIAGRFGMDALYAPYLSPDERPQDAVGWRSLGKKLSALAKPIRDEGYDFGWHNHDFEFVALSDGSLPIERIFEGGPDLSWEADIAWVIRGGADPVEWIDKLGSHITSVHVKDIAPKGEARDEDGWADVGYGIVPWGKLMPLLKKTSARHFIVEHDNPNDIDRLIGRSAQSLSTY